MSAAFVANINTVLSMLLGTSERSTVLSLLAGKERHLRFNTRVSPVTDKREVLEVHIPCVSANLCVVYSVAKPDIAELGATRLLLTLHKGDNYRRSARLYLSVIGDRLGRSTPRPYEVPYRVSIYAT